MVRQRRLLGRMEGERWDVFVTANYRTVYYLSGYLSAPDVPAVLILWSDGSSTLISASDASAIATDRMCFATGSISPPVGEAMECAVGLLKSAVAGKLGSGTAQFAIERTTTPGIVETVLEERWPRALRFDASRIVLALRKRKEQDEIDEIRASLELCAAAYGAARDVIKESVTELDVHNAMYAAVTHRAQTSLHLVGDFASGVRARGGGGPPTSRQVLPGELMILDISPGAPLYFGDTCRTFAHGTPSDLQLEGWEAVCGAIRLAEGAIRVGVRACDVYNMMKDLLDSCEVARKSFWHHAGHGIGHGGHEAPHVTATSEHMFQDGDVIAIEPGIYGQHLNGGIRLENNYVVRQSGLENLFTFPLEL